MAESDKTLNRFKEELTCPICKNIFEEPKTLSCLHSFCEGCLSRHIKKRPLDDEPGAQDNRAMVPCPLCKEVQVLDKPDVSLVKTNLGYKNMVEHLSLENRVRAGCVPSANGGAGDAPICDRCDGSKVVAFCKTCNDRLCEKCREAHRREKPYKSHNVTSLDDVSSSSGSDDSQIVTHYTWRCEKHVGFEGPKQLIEVLIYCKTCDEMICRECSLVEPHGNHDKFEAKKVIDECKKPIRENEGKVKLVKEKFTGFIAEMRDLQNRLKKHRDAAETQINERVKAIHKKLEKDKQELLVKVDRIFNSKNKRLEDQIKELERIEETLKDSRKMVNSTLEVGIPAEILFLKTQFIERMQFLFDKYDPYDRRPRENDILKFNANRKFDFSGALGTVAADPFPSAFTVEALENVHFIQGVKTPITVTCRDIVGTPRPITQNIKSLKVELCFPTNGDTVLGQVEKDVENGTYAVEFEPIMHGKHELKVNVVVGNEEKNIPIEGSPFKVKVSHPIVNEIEAENRVIPGLEHPWGIAVKCAVKHEDGVGGGAGEDGGDIGDGGAERGEDGAREGGARVGDKESDIIAISDVGTHRIAVITKNNFQNPQWIGMEGDGDLQFNSPRGIAFDLNGDIAVVEKDNCRVQIVSVEGVFKFKFGKKGLKNGEFERPTDIVVNKDGIMFVSDSNSNRIQYFKPNGEFLGHFGKQGPLNTPYALACDGLGRILITEQNRNRIQCWNSATTSNSLEGDSSTLDDSSSSSGSLSGQDDFECVFKSDGFFEPVGIACHPESEYIVVTEMKKHRVSILDKNGRLLRQLGQKGMGDNEFTAPMGINVLGDSRMIICDCGKKKILIFNIV